MSTEQAAARFRAQFGVAPSHISYAPGRVNLIGEHTDYNDGFVLPMAISRAVWIAARTRQDNEMHAYSEDYAETSHFSLEQLEDTSLPHWTHHLRGVWFMLRAQRIQVPAVDVLITGNVPIGAGLSSSAAIEVALIELALALVGVQWEQKGKALFGVKVEHEFSGVPCGVMDQMASAVSREGHALLIDCRSLETKPVHLPESASIMVMDTAKRRTLATSAYGERRRQCEEAAATLGVASLRDATLEQLHKAQATLDDVHYRRAKHILTENFRTLEAVRAFEQNDLTRAGILMNESHFSLRDDYEVSCHELDVITELARQQPGCYGARMTGGGFGGCAVALLDAESDHAAFESAIRGPYQEATGLEPVFYVFQPALGSHIVVWQG